MWYNALYYQAYTVSPPWSLPGTPPPLVYIRIWPSLLSYRPYTRRHTNIYCLAISIRLWAPRILQLFRGCRLNETIIRTLKSLRPQMIRKERTREEIKRKRGMMVKIPTKEPIHSCKPLLRVYFSPGVRACWECVCVYVCKCESVSGRGIIEWQTVVIRRGGRINQIVRQILMTFMILLLYEAFGIL